MTNTPQALAKQRATRRANVEAGFTIYGTERKNKIWTELKGLHGYERTLKRVSLYNQQKRAGKYPSDQSRHIQHQTVIEELDAFAFELMELSPSLPPEMRQKSIHLFRRISNIRKIVSRKRG